MNNFAGFSEWQLYGLIEQRSANSVAFVCCLIVTSLGIVSLPRYSEMWQISFTALLVVPATASAVLIGTSAGMEDSLRKQLNFVFTERVAEDVRRYVELELGAVTLEDCVSEAIKRVQPFRRISVVVAWLLFVMNFANLLVNLVFVLLFEVIDEEMKFAETTVEEEDMAEPR